MRHTHERSVAVGLVALTIIIPTLANSQRLPRVYRPIGISLGLAGVAAITVDVLRPTTWLLALLLVLVLSAVWSNAIGLWIKRTDEDEHVPSLD